MKIAAVSEDGVTISQHFGRAPFYVIVTVEDGKIVSRETRDNRIEAQKKMTLPKVGLFACFSGGSNSGSLAGMAGLEVARRLGKETVGICSLPAVLKQIPRQSALVKQIESLMVIDGCRNACARHLLAEKGIKPDVYLNLETDLDLTKQGPFSSLAFTDDEVKLVADAIIAAVEKLPNDRRE